jgi:hypothetical protein
MGATTSFKVILKTALCPSECLSDYDVTQACQGDRHWAMMLSLSTVNMIHVILSEQWDCLACYKACMAAKKWLICTKRLP